MLTEANIGQENEFMLQGVVAHRNPSVLLTFVQVG